MIQKRAVGETGASLSIKTQTHFTFNEWQTEEKVVLVRTDQSAGILFQKKRKEKKKNGNQPGETMEL